MKVNCKQAVGQLAEYLDKAVKHDVRDAIVAHMQRCPACVTFTETYKKTTTLCRKTLLREAPPGLAEKVLEFVRQQTGKS